jgi:hypothetical protein
MLATLAWQLISTLPNENLSLVAPKLAVMDNTGIKELVELLLIAARLHKSPCFLIVDGLDESTEEWTRDSEGLKSVIYMLQTHP